MTPRPRWPFVLHAGVVLFCVRTVAALLLALPLTSSLGRRLAPVGGETRLFRDGGALALELLQAVRGSIGGALLGGGVSLALASVLSLAPLGVVIARLSTRAPLGVVGVARAATRPFAGLAVLLGVATLLELLVTLLAMVGLRVVATHAFAGDARSADLGAWGAGLLGLIPLALVGIVHDAARCVHVARHVGFYDATSRALAVFRARFASLTLHYVARAAASVAALGGAAAVTVVVGMGSVAHLVLCAVVQQLALLVAATLRASWLSRLLAIEAATPSSTTSDAVEGG